MKKFAKYILLLTLLQNHTFFSHNTIIILYGCSSAGKTSISSELLRILPGNWKYIASNRFSVTNKNQHLWNEVNRQISYGYDVIVDTHDAKFLIDNIENMRVVVSLIYCSPEKLIEHVQSRNSEDNAQNHRAIKAVFQEFCQKYKVVKKNKTYIDTLNKEQLKKSYGFFINSELKKIMQQYFNDDQNVVYLAPLFLKKYDCFINTGKISIQQCAQKIKDKLME